MTFQSLIDEVRSREPEKIIVDAVLKQLSTWFFAVVVVLVVLLKDHIPIGKYILAPTQAWRITAVAVMFASAILLRYRTQWGRKRRLRYYLRLIRRCKRFDHNEELEALSRIHSSARYAAIIGIATVLFALPLVIFVMLTFGIALEADITNSIKGTNINPNLSLKLGVTIYGAILAVMLHFVMYYLDKGNQEAMMLSPSYRRNRLVEWEEMVSKLKSQVRKARKEKIVTARSNAASA